MSQGKAPGLDGTPAEIYKQGGYHTARHLTWLFHFLWEQESVPQDFSANTVHLYQGKGESTNCDNHHGISLLFVSGKIISQVMLNRLNTYLLETILPSYRLLIFLNLNMDFSLVETVDT